MSSVGKPIPSLLLLVNTLTRKPAIALSEMMTIEITYHPIGHKCFEYFYPQKVENGALYNCFPMLPPTTALLN